MTMQKYIKYLKPTKKALLFTKTYPEICDFQIYCLFLSHITLAKEIMKSTAEILYLLGSYKDTATSKYGLTKIGIFGSVARGEQTENSDVDICYEGKAPSFLTLDLIQTDLEKLLGAKVDLVRIREKMNHSLKQRIQKEGIYV